MDSNAAVATASGGGGSGLVIGPIPKREILAQALARGEVLVNVDGRASRLPGELGERPVVVLRIAWQMTPPIDLRLGDDAVRANLKFGALTYHCVVPWDALFAMSVVGEKHVVMWPEDQPGQKPRAERPEERQVCLASVDGKFDESLTTPARGELRAVT